MRLRSQTNTRKPLARYLKSVNVPPQNFASSAASWPLRAAMKSNVEKKRIGLDRTFTESSCPNRPQHRTCVAKAKHTPVVCAIQNPARQCTRDRHRCALCLRKRDQNHTQSPLGTTDSLRCTPDNRHAMPKHSARQARARSVHTVSKWA